jgi:predicted alpha/beta-hydrolase family hydrolase
MEAGTRMVITDGASDARVTFLFAHGAGGGIRTTFMTGVARGLAAKGIRVVRFEFPYMAAGKKAPDRMPVLLDSWREKIREESGVVFIGGKSMGGRVATMVADEMQVKGVVCFGYPFHPPGKPDQLRTEHLGTMHTPLLILQGERDTFGHREEVAKYKLSNSIRIEWLKDGDHSLKPRASSGVTEKENIQRAIALAAEFMVEG